MTLKERNGKCAGFFERCLGILDRKGADYEVAGDALKEITQLAEQLQITPEQVLWVYMYKHLAALLNWLQRGGRHTDTVFERLCGIANYCALMYVIAAELVVIDGLVGDQTPAAGIEACDRLADSL